MIDDPEYKPLTNFMQNEVQVLLLENNPMVATIINTITLNMEDQAPRLMRDPSISDTSNTPTMDNTQTPIIIPNDPSIITNNMEVQAPPTNFNKPATFSDQTLQHAAHISSASNNRCQYSIFTGSPSFYSYKKQKGIDGHIYVLNAATAPLALPVQFQPNSTSTFNDLPTIHTGI